jgi:hypothetical protein
VDVAYGLSLDQFKPVPHRDTTFTFVFQNDLVFFDSTYKRVSHEQFYQQRKCPPNYDHSKLTLTGEKSGFLEPGKHEVALQMYELSNKMADFKKEEITIRDFSGDKLMISDVKLSPHIEILGLNIETNGNELYVMPYPYNTISKNIPVYIYFEIYNLALIQENNTNYEISFRMERRIKKEEYAVEIIRSFGRIFTGGKPQEIETSYQRQGNSRMSKEWVELDITDIKSGYSRLMVTVKDLNMGSEVNSSVEFELED